MDLRSWKQLAVDAAAATVEAEGESDSRTICWWANKFIPTEFKTTATPSDLKFPFNTPLADFMSKQSLSTDMSFFLCFCFCLSYYFEAHSPNSFHFMTLRQWSNEYVKWVLAQSLLKYFGMLLNRIDNKKYMYNTKKHIIITYHFALSHVFNVCNLLH